VIGRMALDHLLDAVEIFLGGRLVGGCLVGHAAIIVRAKKKRGEGPPGHSPLSLSAGAFA
jgi:hypothetical protein